MADAIPLPKDDFGNIAVACITCGNPIRIRGTKVFPICRDCIAMLRDIIAERKNKTE